MIYDLTTMLRTDNEGEFTLNEFENSSKEEIIVRLYTNAYTP